MNFTSLACCGVSIDADEQASVMEERTTCCVARPLTETRQLLLTASSLSFYPHPKMKNANWPDAVGVYHESRFFHEGAFNEAGSLPVRVNASLKQAHEGRHDARLFSRADAIFGSFGGRCPRRSPRQVARGSPRIVTPECRCRVPRGGSIPEREAFRLLLVRATT